MFWHAGNEGTANRFLSGIEISIIKPESTTTSPRPTIPTTQTSLPPAPPTQRPSNPNGIYVHNI